jgi:rhamnosyltransferase
VRLLQIEPAAFNHGTTRTLGAASTTGEWIVFMNGHVWPADEHWLSALLAPFAWDPRVAGVYSRQLPKPGCTPAMACEGYLPPLGQVKSLAGLTEVEIRRHLRELIFFTTVSCAIRRSVWEQIPFQDGIPAAEDQDWGKRALEAGYSLVYEPASRVLHSHNYAPGQYYRRAYLLRRQMARILDQRPSAARVLVALPARVLRDVLRDAALMRSNGYLSPGALFGSLALRTANSLAVTRADWEAR